jgi:hypothetical protein
LANAASAAESAKYRLDETMSARLNKAANAVPATKPS